jgi:hypothetical protein
MAGWTKGRNYFIRTVTMSLTGTLADFDDKELVLRDAAWIAVTGRFAESLVKGAFEEVEEGVGVEGGEEEGRANASLIPFGCGRPWRLRAARGRFETCSV